MAKKAKPSEEQPEDYEIVPLKRVLELEKNVKGIRSDPLGSTAQGKEMVSSMRNLSKSMEGMVDLFRDAADSMKGEEAESELLSNKLDPLMEKLDKVIDQNTKIAKGILTVADMIKEDIEERKKIALKQPLPPGPIPPPRLHGMGPPPRPMPMPMPGQRSPPPMSQDELLSPAPGQAPAMGARGPLPPQGSRPMPPPQGMPPPSGMPPPPGNIPPPPGGMGMPPPPGIEPPKKKKSLFGR